MPYNCIPELPLTKTHHNLFRASSVLFCFFSPPSCINPLPLSQKYEKDELSEEMAHLEGLMKDLNAITTAWAQSIHPNMHTHTFSHTLKLTFINISPQHGQSSQSFEPNERKRTFWLALLTLRKEMAIGSRSEQFFLFFLGGGTDSFGNVSFFFALLLPYE